MGVCGCDAGDQTYSLVSARQALYHKTINSAWEWEGQCVTLDLSISLEVLGLYSFKSRFTIFIAQLNLLTQGLSYDSLVQF